MRTNKFLAEAGVCSRREADKLIESGKVKINGKTAKLGDRVSANDEVTLNGELVVLSAPKVYLAFHKPYGVITTTDKKSHNTVMDYVQPGVRVFPVGRLDVESSGLLLLTNNGDIVNKLLKSENKLEKEYVVTLNKTIRPEDIQKLRSGVRLENRKTLPAEVTRLGARKIDMILVQGMNRQIRRMCEKLGYEVKALERVRIGDIQLGELPAGTWRFLTEQEVKSLIK